MQFEIRKGGLHTGAFLAPSPVLIFLRHLTEGFHYIQKLTYTGRDFGHASGPLCIITVYICISKKQWTVHSAILSITTIHTA